MFKKRNLFTLSVLAIASLLSVVGLTKTNTNAVKAEEATSEETTRFILDVRALESGWGGDIQLFLQKGTDESSLMKLDCKKSNSYLLYYCDVANSYFTEGYSAYGFRKVTSDGHNTIWNYFSWWNATNSRPNYCKGNSYNYGSNNVNSTWESTSDWGTWSIVGNWEGNEAKLNEKLEYENDDNEVYQLVKKSLSFTVGDEFKIVYNSGKTDATDEYHGYKFIDEKARSDLKDILSGSDDSNIKVEKDVVLDFYFKPLIGGSIWIQEDSTAAATKFAEQYLEATKSICNDNGATDHLEALNRVYPDLIKAYAALSLGAKDVFSKSDDETIVHARTLADHIASRYGLRLEQTESSLNPAINRTSANDIMLMIVLTSATLVSAAAVIYLVSKKRKLHR